MVRVANPSHVKAARLRESGIEWSIALEKAKVPDTDLTRKSVRRIIRELVSTAKAEAQAERDAADAEVRAKRKDLKVREAARPGALVAIQEGENGQGGTRPGVDSATAPDGGDPGVGQGGWRVLCCVGQGRHGQGD